MNKSNIGQKILHFPLTKIIIGIISVAGVFILSKNILKEILQTDFLTTDITNLLVTIISSFLSLITYIYLYKFYEKRKITEFSTNRIGKHLLLGILIGVIAQSLTILVIYLNGGYSIVSIN